ncbi:hypothetical protein [Nocardia pseudobrasiliensis]|uniref:YtkA-like protein n=1 Tax=Nocardia pseudobrasiliensis TaxID=45979 RepID=A0A370I1K1_9NOCA|nr:hypothetical protein [Nocardia pseudobrasiliensis]RDI64607.1 hypothetical protein DFR76_108440 [Nocardia pseudobrasiliensis]
MTTDAARCTSMRVAALAAVVILVLAGILWLLWPSPPGSLTLRSGTARHLVTVTVAHPRLGDSALDIDLTDHDGRVVDTMVHLQVIDPRMGYAAPVVMAKPVRPGRFHVPAVSFMSTGPWELRLTLSPADGDDDRIGLPLWISG